MDNYFIIQKNGVIRYRHSNKVVKTRINDNGYEIFSFKIDGKVKTIRVHRLLCLKFIENTNNKPFVNHKNGIKSDNRICNLEWVTRSENAIHAHKMGLIKKQSFNSHKGKVKVLDIKTGRIYGSLKEASINNGINISTLSKKLKGETYNNTNLITYHDL